MPAPSGCRCLPYQPCWSAIPWGALNSSVGGRLLPVHDELEACRSSMHSLACAKQLNGSNDEFWLSSQPGGFLHTGEFLIWNISRGLSSYAVAAASDEDMKATVVFAQEHNLRLVVKGTGHDWFGRSGGNVPGSLMLWTHMRKHIAFNESFVQAGSTAAVPAVTVESGVQFRDLYPCGTGSW